MSTITLLAELQAGAPYPVPGAICNWWRKSKGEIKTKGKTLHVYQSPGSLHLFLFFHQELTLIPSLSLLERLECTPVWLWDWIQLLPSSVQAFMGAVSKIIVQPGCFTLFVITTNRWDICTKILAAVLTKASEYFLEEWNIWPICKYFSLVDKSFSHHLVPVDYHKRQASKLHAEDVPIPSSKLKESSSASESKKGEICKTHLGKTSSNSI